jgi:HD-GYP domain-containing protein (c-di-GMP phosphodiesterase class II)
MAGKSSTQTSKPRSKGGRTGNGAKANGRSGANGNGQVKANGNGRAKANGNGHGNGNGRVKTNGNGNGRAKANGNGNGRAKANGNGNGVPAVEPLAEELIEAVAAGDTETTLTKAQARRVASAVGSAMLIETSVETAKHSDDVVVIARALCEQMGVTGTDRADLLAAARLHDIGKAAMPVEILEKPASLSSREWKLMREHTIVGERILASVPELNGIGKLVRHSHERWDGNGYPDGLAKDEIPLGSRIIFCADAFHAIRCDRAYRPGRSAALALKEVKRGSGTQFDPTVVTALDEVVRDLRLVPAKGRIKRSSRLSALLLVLAIGGGGSAIAETGILGDLQFGGEAQTTISGDPITEVLGVDLPEYLASLDPRIARALDLQASGKGPNATARERGGKVIRGSRIEGGRPGTSVVGVPAENGPADGEGNDQGNAGGSEETGPGGGGESSSGGGGSSSSGGGGNPNHPLGGPPGQTGNHPQGGPPGQTGNHPKGGPPGQTGTAPGLLPDLKPPKLPKLPKLEKP